MATETRSHKGCWSCRLRKKKCDERRPICSECVCVGLECDGFGEKPPWMDRGARQKIQAAKIKQKVAQMTKTRRINQNRDQNRSPTQALQTPRTTSPASTASGGDAPSTTATNNHLLTLHDTFAVDDVCANFFHLPPEKPLSPEFYPRGDLNAATDSLLDIDPTLLVSQVGVDDMAFLSNQNFGLPQIESAGTGDADAAHNLLTPDPSEHRQSTCSAPESQSDADFSRFESAPMLPVRSVEEAILLAHYMEKVFHWQFRFCCTSSCGFCQGHFIWLMSKSRALFLASMALSRLWKSVQTVTEKSERVMMSEDVSTGYDLAQAELRRDVEGSKPSYNVSNLACILSLISCSYLQPDKIDWTTHLKTGVSLIEPWIEQQKIEAVSDRHEMPDDSARNFFIASIIRLDVLSAVTRDSAPALSESYQKVLRSSSEALPFESVCGCQAWVFGILLDLYALRDWKRNARAARRLSLWELTTKANSIKTDLELRITSNLAALNRLKQGIELRKDKPSQSSRDSYHVYVITNAFACALSVLLEVIVSGAYPELPELKFKVEQALESFACVDDVDIYENLGWPMFVVGCVVEERHYGRIRGWMSSSREVQSVCLRGPLQLLEECWRSRQRGDMLGDNMDLCQAGMESSCRVLVA